MGNSGDLLACAHRYYNPRYQSASGACVLINTSTSDVYRTINPLDLREELYRYDERKREYRSYYANGQFGMSAVFTKDDRRFCIGAPGVFEGTGTDLVYSSTTIPNLVRDPLPLETHSYYGYSITRGYFYKVRMELSAIGAPREEYFGKVYIRYDFYSTDYAMEILKGFEVGEYFGFSVLGVDLNGDELSDLLVGAPLYSVDTGCDEGRVYVYLSDGKEMNLLTELEGDHKVDARFGTALSNIGDLNQDGFQDIAVGAPYEDGKGAVYIYLGSETGIKQKYSQKIKASEINTDLSGFGIHISLGKDMDDNGYPDIAVGSYLSSNVVFLRSLPVIDVSLNFTFDPPDIRMHKAECLYESKKLPCVHIDVCLQYTGKRAPDSLDFLCSIMEEDPNPRGFFLPYQYKNAATQRNLTAKNNNETCLTLQFFLHSDIKDIVTSVPINLFCELAPQDLDPQYNAFERHHFLYPVVSPSSALNMTKLLPFHSGCVQDQVCFSDLILTAELEGMANDSSITLGEVTSVTLDVTVLNDGDPAYDSKLEIILPPDVPVISKDTCKGESPRENEIRCDLGNPLAKDKMVSFRIKLDLTKLTYYHAREIEITLVCSTTSQDVNGENNRVNLTLGIQTLSDIGIRGIPSPSLILYHETEDLSSNIKHRFTVRNHGPSPLHTINVILQVPSAILSSRGRKEFLVFTGLQTDTQSEMTVPSACNTSHLDRDWFLPAVTSPKKGEENTTFVYGNDSFSNSINKRDTGRKSLEDFDLKHLSSRGNASWKHERANHVLSCDSSDIECVTIQCSASPFFDLRKFAEVSVTFQVHFSVLQSHFESWSQIELISTASIFSPDNDDIVSNHPKISRVKTVFIDERYSGRDVPQWLYFASFSIGIMLLLQVVFVLIKAGFFKRKEKMALDRLKQSFFEANLEDEFLIDPSENDDATDEDSENGKEEH